MIRIESSEGTMFCDDEGVPYGELPEGYQDVAKFDIDRLERMCTSMHISMHRRGGWDVLALGFWTHDGLYESPAPSYAENGVMRHIWMGLADDIDEAIEMGGDW